MTKPFDSEVLLAKIKVVLKENDYETIEAIKNLNVEIIMQTGNGYGNALIEGINTTNTKYFSIFNNSIIADYILHKTFGKKGNFKYIWE